jgi:hypothetical protein
MTTPAPAPPSLRTFGLILAGFIATVFGAAFPLFGVYAFTPWVPAAAAAIAATAVAEPRLLVPVHAGGRRVGHVLGWVNTRLLLGVVFFGLILPIGLLRRWLSPGTMPKGVDPTVSTYRVPCERSVRRDSFQRPY